jgi:dTDP-glucose 4,6-dehydratase
VYKPLPQDDPMQRQPDITLAKKLLKWQPKVDRATGLKITYAYFKSLSAKELHEKDHNSFEGYVRK